MEDYFFESLARGLGGLAYRKYGTVKVSILGDEDNTFVRTVVYDAPSFVINELDDDSKKEREAFFKEYDISDVDFADELTVFKKLNSITSDLEISFQK